MMEKLNHAYENVKLAVLYCAAALMALIEELVGPHAQRVKACHHQDPV